MPNFTRDKLEIALENENNAKIMELNSATIAKEKNDILQKLQLPREKLKYFTQTLKYYRYIDSVDDIILGNFIRWLNLSDPENLKLTNGGFVSDFKETPETIYIVCKNALGRFFNVDIHKCLVFQKLNAQEETLLAVINYLNKK
jgi:hypothetical protein